MNCGSHRQNLGLESVFSHERAKKELGIFGKKNLQTCTQPPELMVRISSCTHSAALLGWPSRTGKAVDSRFDEQKGGLRPFGAQDLPRSTTQNRH